MAKRIKKPPVKLEKRYEWLRRHEMGESVPKIADADEFDVRTVRRHIELAKQEREVKEARAAVLRNALERHYEDLGRYAEMLNSQISGVRIESVPDADLMKAALRQHLPHSPIWSYLAKWQSLRPRLAEQQQKEKVEALIEQAVKAERRLTPLVDAGLNGIIPGITEALKLKADQWSHGYEGLNLKDNLLTEPVGEGQVNLHYGVFYIIDRMDPQHADEYFKIVREALEALESCLRESEEYRGLERTISEIERLRRKFLEELAIIRLRRIVPGRCKYCPL